MNTVILSVGSRYPVNRKQIKKFVLDFLHTQNIDGASVSLSIVGERKIKYLNEKYLGHQGCTDVLSFPQYDKGSEKDYESTLLPVPQINPHGVFVAPTQVFRALGDVVVCFPEAVRQAMKKGKMVDAQICSLIEHSLLHLLGIHHE